MTALARELKQARQSRNLTLKQVAEAVGLSVSYISDLERGRTVPSLKTLGKLEHYFGKPETTFADVRDGERYITVLRSDWDRMKSLATALLAIHAKYADEE